MSTAVGQASIPKFAKTTTVEREVIRTTENSHAVIDGYDVFVVRASDGSVSLEIYPTDSKSFPRLGIIRCDPHSVKDIERFARVAAHLFFAIASGMRAAGFDDLRSAWEIEYERVMADLRRASRAAETDE